MVRNALIEVQERDMDAVIQLIRNIGQYFSDDDAVYHDDDLEEALPEVVTAILQYPNPKQAMFQVLDTITRLVEDPDINEAVREMGR